MEIGKFVAGTGFGPRGYRNTWAAIGIAIGIVWKSVTLRPGQPLGPSATGIPGQLSE